MLGRGKIWDIILRECPSFVWREELQEIIKSLVRVDIRLENRAKDVKNAQNKHASL
jgi:hypothetical protein